MSKKLFAFMMKNSGTLRFERIKNPAAIRVILQGGVPGGDHAKELFLDPELFEEARFGEDYADHVFDTLVDLHERPKVVR